MLQHEGLNCFLMKLLVECGILGVHKDLFVLERDTVLWFLIENDVKLDLVGHAVAEHGVVNHFLPCWPLEWVVLHRLIQEVERVERDLDVAWPAPRTLLHLVVEGTHGVLSASRAIYAEDEHASEHLVEDDTHGPHIDLVTVA